MSNIPAILSATLTVSLAACGGGGSDTRPIGQPVTTPLITLEGKSVGTVTLYNSTDGFFITAATDAGWELRQTRLAVARSLDCIPHFKSGEAQVDRFLLRKEGRPGTTQLGYNLPLLVDPGTELFIALNADVCPATTPPPGEGHSTDAGQKKGDPSSDGQEGNGHDGSGGGDDHHTSAWAQGLPFPGDDGSMYLTYIVRAAAPPSLAGKYATYAQATWGAAPGTNPASSFLLLEFMKLYSGGLRIGTSPGNIADFLSIQAIDMFLPESGAPTPLTHSVINPPNLSNPFAGEVLALTLNVSLDAFNASSAPAGQVPLSSLVVADPASALYGLTVGDVLTDANLLLSGQATPGNVMLADAYDAVSRINANFENGTADLGFLSVP